MTATARAGRAASIDPAISREAVTIHRRATAAVHGAMTPDHVEITWSLPDPLVIADHETIALIAELITPDHDDLELALFIAGSHATGCLTSLAAPRPRELEQVEVAYDTDGFAFTARFPRHWVPAMHHDAGLAGSISVDGHAPLRFAGLFESLRETA